MIRRIYFHKREAGVVWWSIDEGDPSSEIHVRWIRIEPGLSINSGTKVDAIQGEPSAWFEVWGAELKLEGSMAILRPHGAQ